MKQKYFGRERICKEFINVNEKGKTLNIGAGEVVWIENDLFRDKDNFYSSDIEKENLSNNNLAKNKIVASATKLPFKDSELSQVIMLDVLEHIKEDGKALEEINRVLGKKGRFVICVPNDTLLSFLNPVRYVQHERHYKIDKLKNLLNEKGFKVEKMFAGGGIFELLNLYTHFFIKYTTRRIINPSFFNKLRDYEYRKHNLGGNEIAILAFKK